MYEGWRLLAVAEHYYSNQPTAAHDRKMLEVELRGKKLKLMTDTGVFSKGAIDFGSRLLIETIEIAADANVLDIGCGYGPIGLSAALLAPQGRVTMADVNERALALAAENARLNGIRNVQIVISDLFQELSGMAFSVIVSNPPIRAGKQIVHRLFEDAYAHLVDNGELWIVIQKKQGAPSAVEKLEQLFGDVKEITRSKGYWIIKAKKNAIGPMSG